MSYRAYWAESIGWDDTYLDTVLVDGGLSGALAGVVWC